MAELQLQPPLQTDVRAKAHLALIERLQDPSFGGKLDLSTILVYRIPSLVNSAVLAMAWQWDVLNPLLLPVGTTLSIDDQYRMLIQLSTKLHSVVGTPQSLINALEGLGIPNPTLQEGQNSWGGSTWPSNEGWAVFRVIINILTLPAGTTIATLDPIIHAIANFWKPARCWLDSVQYTMALTDTLMPAPSDSLVNIFSRTDVVTPAPSDFIVAPFYPVSDTKTITSLHNNQYQKSNSVTYGTTQPTVAEGAVVVNTTPVEVS